MTTPWTADQDTAAPPPQRRRGGFWAGLGRFLLWTFAVLGVLLVGGGVLALIVVLRMDRTPALPDGPFILAVDLQRGVVERTASGVDPLGGVGDPIAVRPLADALELAAIDPQVRGVALNLGSSGISLATAGDIREAVETVVAAGKPVYAFAPSFGLMSAGTVDYYLASVADEIWVAPSGDVNLIGLSLEVPFVGDALDDLEVQVEMAAREEYKSALETFTRTGFSGPARDSLQRLVDSMHAVVAAGIAAGRGLAPDRVRAAIDAAPMGADEAISAGLVDYAGYTDEFFAALRQRHDGAEIATLPAYLGADEDPGSPRANVAYIQALGPVADAAGDPYDTTLVAPDNVGAALASALEDPAIDAVVLRIDSPGGSYTGADAIWREVIRLREAGKPVVASMGSVAASGGYFIAMGADRIVAQPGTITGSIGVFAGKMVLDAATRNFGVTWDRVMAGENADMYSWTESYSPAQWQALNAILDRIYRDFVTKAAAGRGMEFDAMESAAGGRIWTGADALEHGLVDSLGGPSRAFAEVRDLLGLPVDAPLGVRILPPVRTPLETLFALFEDPTAGVAVQVTLPAALADWPEILEILDQPGPQLRLPPMRVEG